MGDLNEISNKVNFHHGWEANQNPPPMVEFNPNGWPNWPEQEGDVMGENELAENAANNAILQHLE